ncbi:hypothetical protein [Sinomonas sp. G460-2]|uniref:hypothetical protein n=1 Tax=Sinomonas sp. G460-2 TaxID=3393464 RepID=UPI0039F0156C
MTTHLPRHEAAVLLDSVAAQLGNTPGVLMVAQKALAEAYREHNLDEPAEACDARRGPMRRSPLRCGGCGAPTSSCPRPPTLFTLCSSGPRPRQPQHRISRPLARAA